MTASTPSTGRLILLAVSMSLSLLIFCGCSPALIALRPDAELTRDCERPPIGGRTYRELGKLAVAQDRALEECTARMRALRE